MSHSPYRTLTLDRRAERSVAALRLSAAVAVAAGAAWLASLRPPALMWVCILAALAASVMWVVMGMRSRRRIVDADRHRLVLEPDALTLVEGRDEREVRWDAVEAIETDEERLVVRVRVRGEEPLSIEPRYGGLGASDLEEAIRQAMVAGRPSEDGGTP